MTASNIPQVRTTQRCRAQKSTIAVIAEFSMMVRLSRYAYESAPSAAGSSAENRSPRRAPAGSGDGTWEQHGLRFAAGCVLSRSGVFRGSRWCFKFARHRTVEGGQPQGNIPVRPFVARGNGATRILTTGDHATPSLLRFRAKRLSENRERRLRSNQNRSLDQTLNRRGDAAGRAAPLQRSRNMD